MKLTLTDSERLITDAFPDPQAAFLAAEAAENARLAAETAAYALALLALVAGLAWLIERLPPGVGSVVAVGGTVAVVWVVLGGGRR